MLWNVKVTVIPILIDAFGTIFKGNWKSWKQDHSNYRTVKINLNIEKSLEEICSQSDSSERPANIGVKKLTWGNNNNNNSSYDKKKKKNFYFNFNICKKYVYTFSCIF